MNNDGNGFVWTLLVLLAANPAGSAQGLSPDAPPGQNFDLSHWQLTLPVDSSGGSNGTAVEIDPSDLTAGYLNAPYFCTGGDGAIVFECPAVGATTSGSEDPRTELRELINTNDNSIDWPPNGYNVLTAQCAVNGVAPGGSLGLGQIHGYSVNIPLVILRYDNTLNQGTIDATVKYMSDGTPYNNHTDNVLTFTNVGLNAPINYQLVLSNGVVFITVNGVTQSQNLYASDTNWANVSFYFKAGNYYLDNGGTSLASQVSFYALNASHGPVISSVVRAGSKLVFGGFGGQAGSNYEVRASTNLAMPFSAWSSVQTKTFDSNGNFNFTESFGTTQRKFYIIKQK